MARTRWRRLLGALLALAVVYLALSAGLAWAMSLPPRGFSRIMRHLPEPLVFGVLRFQ